MAKQRLVVYLGRDIEKLDALKLGFQNNGFSVVGCSFQEVRRKGKLFKNPNLKLVVFYLARDPDRESAEEILDIFKMINLPVPVIIWSNGDYLRDSWKVQEEYSKQITSNLIIGHVPVNQLVRAVGREISEVEKTN